MFILSEGELEFTFEDAISARKFDGADHRLSHCMKAVDFIVEFADRYLFVEVKDPQHSRARERDSRRWINRFTSSGLDQDLLYKYRDSFLYEWASGRADKPIVYVALIALDTLDSALLQTRQRDLGNSLPLQGPGSQTWVRPFVSACLVLNVESWNRSFPAHPVRRVEDSDENASNGGDTPESDLA